MEILNVTVGSRLHGLDGPDSDTDTKGVYVQSLEDLTSPFVQKDARAHEVDQHVSFELKHFCRLAAGGNPTVLEVLGSDLVNNTTYWGRELQQNKWRFFDGNAVRNAALGYARQQQNLMDVRPDRLPKALVARIRILHQATRMLDPGVWCGAVTDLGLNSFLRQVKYNYTTDLLDVGITYVESWEEALKDATTFSRLDKGWINNFCHRVYLRNERVV
jgi:hypothetical protein